MELTTKTRVDEATDMVRVFLDGALNSDTAPTFERELTAIVDSGYRLVVLDMAALEYISSAGLRVVFKAAKQLKSEGRSLAVANRQAQIAKVFEILQALPDMRVFADERELDDYLHAMQTKSRDA